MIIMSIPSAQIAEIEFVMSTDVIFPTVKNTGVAKQLKINMMINAIITKLFFINFPALK